MTYDPANIDKHVEELTSLRRQVQSLEDQIAHLTAEKDKKDKTLRDNEAKLRQVIDLVPPVSYTHLTLPTTERV